jgi:multiple sugar transport system substrate-binding protein
MEDFYPIGLKAYMFNGKLYGLPQKGSTVTMYYNKNLFDKAGLSYPDYSWTFDDFLHAAKKLTRDTDGDGRIDQIGCLPYSVYTWLWASGGAILSKDGQRILLMEPATLKGLQFFIDLRNRYHVAPRQMSIEGTDKTALTVFDGGRVGMEISGPWRLPRYSRIRDFAWDVAPLPKGPAGRGARYAGVCFSVWKGTKHPKLAWQLLRHMVSAKSQRLLAEAGSDVPSRRSVAETAFLHDKRIKADKQVFLEQLTHDPRLVPSTPLLGRILVIFNEQFELAMVGKSDLKPAMVDAKRQIEALLRQYKTGRAQR